MMVCCTWFAGFQPFYWNNKLLCEGLWCLLHMVCRLRAILLHQQIVKWGNMMVCCTWFAGFQPSTTQQCENWGIWWFAAMVCWLSAILLEQQIAMWGTMMVCCTWFAGFEPFYYISKLLSGGIWWFAAHGLQAFSHLLYTAKWELGNMMVCCTWFVRFQPFYYIRKFRYEEIWWFAAHMLDWLPSFVPFQQTDISGIPYDGWFAVLVWLGCCKPLYTISANWDRGEHYGLQHIYCQPF